MRTKEVRLDLFFMLFRLKAGLPLLPRSLQLFVCFWQYGLSRAGGEARSKKSQEQRLSCASHSTSSSKKFKKLYRSACSIYHRTASKKNRKQKSFSCCGCCGFGQREGPSTVATLLSTLPDSTSE